MKLYKFPSLGFPALVTPMAVAVLVFSGSPRLSAGEPIQFSREKPRATPAPEEPGRVARELAAPTRGLVPQNPLEGLAPVNPEVRTRDPRDERRRRTAANERKNWMFHDRGDSRDREEEEMGVRDYTLEKDDGTADSIFAPRPNDSRNNGRPRPPSSYNRGSKEDPEEAPPAKSAEPAKEARAGGEESQRNRSVGDHVSKDLELHSLLSSGRSSEAEGANRGDAATRNARTTGLPGRTGDAQDVRPGDLNPGGPGLGAPKSSGLSDAFGGGSPVLAPRSTPSTFTPAAPRFSDPNNSLDRNLGGGYNPSRSALDPGAARSFNPTPNLYPPAMNDPAGRPAYGSGGQFGQRPAQSSGPSQSTWERSRIPRP